VLILNLNPAFRIFTIEIYDENDIFELIRSIIVDIMQTNQIINNSPEVLE